MIAEAGTAVGRGKAFAIHEALDQVGAVIGPLLVGLSLALSGSYGPGFLLLAVPGVAAMALLFWLRRRVPDTSVYEPAGNPLPIPDPAGEAASRTTPTTAAASTRLPRSFWLYAGFSGLTMFGYTTFGLISFHLVSNGLLAPAWIPVLYAAAMAMDAVAALVSGWLYDRIGLQVLIALPLLASAVPWLGFSTNSVLAVTGVLLWGAAMGIQESTMRAAVGELAPVSRRGSAYGIFTACYGTAWLAGSILIGALYQQSVLALALTLTIVQGTALAVFFASRPHHSKPTIA